jgi:hypothetical protein
MPARTPARTAIRPLLGALALALIGGVAVLAPALTPAADSVTANVATPGAFRGFGFDQCDAPSQHSMNVWLRQSPYLAAGIYISGNSRGCKTQANLTPDWVTKQLANGWKLIPITVGPQAPCNPRFPRYGTDPVINPKAGTTSRFTLARAQGRAEAVDAVGAAQALGIVPGSTLYYDIEAFNAGIANCRDASMAFLSGWTHKLHMKGYLSGVYSSAGSGIWMLDQARIAGGTTYQLPDQIWIARWDGVADTSTSYIANDGWRPGARMKQYIGGHTESWGGVSINVDRDFLALGQPSAPAETHCGGTTVDFPNYPKLRSGAAADLVTALQCLLSEQQVYAGQLTGQLDQATVAAMNQWQSTHAFPVQPSWSRRNWMSLLASTTEPVVKFGSTGAAVMALQRTLNAAHWATNLAITGIFNHKTDVALRSWQIANQRIAGGVANPSTWKALASGVRTDATVARAPLGRSATFGGQAVRIGPREPSYWWHPKQGTN